MCSKKKIIDNKYRKHIINLVKIVFTLLFIGLLVKMINFEDIYTVFRNVNISTIIIGLVLYILIYILRTLRFKLILNKSLDKRNLFKVVLIHGLYNRVLPFRIGEGAFPYYLKKLENVNVIESSVAVIIVRIFDLVSSILLYIFILSIDISELKNTIVLMLLGIILIICVYHLKQILIYIIKILDRIKAMNKISKLFNDICDIYGNTLTLKKIIVLLLTSVLNWIIMFVVFRLFIIDFKVNILFSDIVLAGSVSNLSSILPISSIGNFGTMEIGWAGVLVARGYESTTAFLTGFSVNMVTFMATTILGLLGLIYLRIKKGGKNVN